MNSDDPTVPIPPPHPPQPLGGIGGLDAGELLARALNTVQPSHGGGVWTPPAPEELAALLPQYHIESLLGAGGMGAVYKGRQAALDRPVAIKLLPAEMATDAQFIARFQREARTLAKLQHPGIVTVYDFGQTSEGHLYFVMEFVDGTDLHRILHAPGGVNPAQALELISQICDALHYAHEKGVIHRDIKPGNILVNTQSRAKLADFGLARPVKEESAMLTASNVIMGTVAYMAPEQHEGKSDQRADIYALGVMLYEMLCGQRPGGAFDPPSQRVQVDVRLDGVVLKALQQQPERRYQHASEMKTDVDRIRTTPMQKNKKRVAAKAEGGTQNAESKPPRLLAKVGALTALTAIILALSVTFWVAFGKKSHRPIADGDASGRAGVSPAAPGILPGASGVGQMPNANTPPARPGVPGNIPGTAGIIPALPEAPAIAKATKESPFVNTLGMKFVPVPGTKVLFGVWDVRVQDYAAYAKAQESAGKKVDGVWKVQQKDGVPCGREQDHPVVGVNWDDAQAFCTWLTQKETAEGKLPKGGGLRYRLPSDEEWSTAIGLPQEVGNTPEEKGGKNNLDFPWGKEWPPTKKVGNYADESFHAKFPPKKNEKDGKMDNEQWLKDYDDGYATTSPVGKFPANAYGLHDMGGNVWQWCEEWEKADHKDRVLRGAAWDSSDRDRARSSRRFHAGPGYRNNSLGFRCVLAASGEGPAAASVGKTGTATTPAEPWRDVLHDEKFVVTGKAELGAGGLQIAEQGGVSVAVRGTGNQRDGAIRVRASFGGRPVQLFARRSVGMYMLYLRETEVVFIRSDATDRTTRTHLFALTPQTRAMRPGEEYELELRVVGQNLTARLDGQVLGTLADSEISRGAFGVASNQSGTPTLIKSLEFLDLDAPALGSLPLPVITGWQSATALIRDNPWAKDVRPSEENGWLTAVQNTGGVLFDKLGITADCALRAKTRGTIYFNLRLTTSKTRNDYYSVGISDVSVSVTIVDYKAAQGNTHRKLITFPIPPAPEHDCLVAMVGPELRIWVDGALVASLHDETYATGSCGFGAFGGKGTAIRDVAVASLPADFFTKATPGKGGGAASQGTRGAASLPGEATKDAPFVNTLGMKFVPVPGTKVFFSIWDTRVQDYAAYAKAQESAGKKVDGSWMTYAKDGVPVARELDHPVGVSWESAQAFCQWLTSKEIAEGKLPQDQRYRLPTDEEWSIAAGLPPEKGATPEEKSLNNDVDFPWGKEWPPTTKVGNYADENYHAKFPPKQNEKDGKMLNSGWLRGYDDGYATTSPVGAFPANAHGLYDMGGNVWQWCEDWWNAEHQERVQRGASWSLTGRSVTRSAHRSHNTPIYGSGSNGFRCVLAASGERPAAASAGKTGAATTAAEPPRSLPLPVITGWQDATALIREGPWAKDFRPTDENGWLTSVRASGGVRFDKLGITADCALRAKTRGTIYFNLRDTKTDTRADKYSVGISEVTANVKSVNYQAAKGNTERELIKVPIPPAPEHDCLVAMVGPELRIWVDGALVASLHDETFPTGPCSFGGFGGKGAVRDFAVASLPADFFTKATPGKGDGSAKEGTRGAASLPGGATKDAPFVNSLGMKFVPVPGTKVLFSVWDTRVQDYTAYAKAQESAGKKVDAVWKLTEKDGVPCGRELDHPVVGVNWDDAQAFCRWLTEKETTNGTLSKGAKYRLPTDAEWSTAVGLPPEQGATPEEKNGKNDVDFPWGKEWPPKGKVGNYADESWHAKFPPRKNEKTGQIENEQWLKGYDDGYATTSPVGKFPANAYGLYDMGGNVWQLCEDWWNAEHKGRVLRGGAWNGNGRASLRSSTRAGSEPTYRNFNHGFRCVLEPAPSAAAAGGK